MRVVQIWRYPVKSLGGEPLRAATLEPGGIAFDRRYILVDSDPRRAGKPLTARIERRLLGYGASVRDDAVVVCAPDGSKHRVEDTIWREDLARQVGREIGLEHAPAPVHDDSDVLVVSAASLRKLADEYGSFVHPLRFRPNVIVDGPDLQPFDEAAWSGEFSVGGATLKTVYPCRRCVVTTVDPESLLDDPSFLRLLTERHDASFGMYCRVARAGDIRVGDEWHAVAAPEVPA